MYCHIYSTVSFLCIIISKVIEILNKGGLLFKMPCFFILTTMLLKKHNSKMMEWNRIVFHSFELFFTLTAILTNSLSLNH